MRVPTLIALAALLSGCGRAYYRTAADRQALGVIAERETDPRWAIPPVHLYPPPASRLHDPFDPDFPPLPPDDPAAYRYMERAGHLRGSRHWHRHGDAPWIEDPAWLDTLELTADGTLALTPERAVELGRLDSREYQTQLETLYLSALALTLNRFEFELHWFATNATTFTHFGSGADEQNTLTPVSDVGFNRAFATGGQLLVDFANTFVFQFAGPDQVTANSNIIVNFTQPLLRFACRDVRMEALTEAERTLLYRVRDFAHFRKAFTFDLATNRYLQLLAQEQQIRNQRSNLASLEQNYRLHEALFASGLVALVKVDQVFQGVQAGKLNLIQAEANLETQKDLYKAALGLPPSLPLRLDDSLLNPFQLTDPALGDLQGEIDRLLAAYRELDQPPSLVKLEDGFRRLQALVARLPGLVNEVGEEAERWGQSLKGPADDAERVARERRARDAIARDIDETRGDLRKLEQALAKDAAALAGGQRKAGWDALLDRTREAAAVAAQLGIIQTQVRVYLIKLRPVPFALEDATRYALDNRLDLMNQRGAVVDAWRQIRVTASALKAGLDIVASANVATRPGGVNPVDFRSSASSYSVGVRFDAPLNRLAERNAYRSSLIGYQSARRAFMDLEDRIGRAVRQDLRVLNTARLNFEIARQSLIIAARQVEAAREQLLQLGANADPTSTQDILNALGDVLRNQNALIDSWVTYETGRMQLLLDLDALQVDERGNYVNNECTDQPGPPGPVAGGPDPPPEPLDHPGRSPYAQPGPPVP